MIFDHDNNRFSKTRLPVLAGTAHSNNSKYGEPGSPTTPMRVAMVTPYWYPVRGGLTTFVSQLADELRTRKAWQVDVIAKEGNPPGAIVVGGGPWRFAWRAWRELERIGPDVVHAHGHWYALLAGIRYRRRHPDTRLVFTIHTEFANDSLVRRLGLRRLMSRADFVTGVSEDLLARTIRSYQPATRIRVTRPGVEIPAIGADLIEEFRGRSGLVGRNPLVAFVGPLAYQAKVEGVSHLIRAMRTVRARHPNAALVIAGDGPLRAPLEARTAREDPGLCMFLGSVDNPTVLMAASDIYAHISFQEGLPLAILEAMAVGTPVVASRVGGIPEVVRNGETGILVSGDPGEIARGLFRLIDSPAIARRLAAAARTAAESRFPWNVASETFVPLYGGTTKHRVLVTADLEQDYGVASRTYRGVEEGLPKLLALFERHGIVADFFVTADLCDAFPDRLKEVIRRGHTVGCHGESHGVAYYSAMPFAWQLESIRRATAAIDACVGVRPVGFRAPNFSANGGTIAALDRLGYEYDSSVLPGRIVRKNGRTVLDFLAAPRDPYHPSRDNAAWSGDSRIWEFPVTENPLALGGPIGLGFVNAFGVDRTFEGLGPSVGTPSIFLIHPWEMIEPPPKGPAWMRTGCTPDTTKLDAFLRRLSEDHEPTTMDRELAAAHRADHRSAAREEHDQSEPDVTTLV